MQLILERIQDKHLRNIGDFECREEEMETFLKNDAYTYDKDGEGNTFILSNDLDEICAYYTVKTNSVQVIDNSSKYAKFRVFPAVEIARLAVDMRFEGKDIGSALLGRIIEDVLEVKKILGIKYIFLFSIPSAVRFYKTKNKAGVKFKEFPKGIEFLKDSLSQDGCTPLYISL